jgi:hypothetical protein
MLIPALLVSYVAAAEAPAAAVPPEAAEMAQLLGLERTLEDLLDGSSRADTASRRDELTRRVLQASFEVDSAIAQIQEEQAALGELLSAIQSDRDARVGILNIAAGVFAAGAAVGTGMTLKESTATAGTWVTTITSGIGAVLTLYAALAPGRGTPPLRTRSNLLAPFFDRPLVSGSYPRVVWTYLSAVAPGDKSTRREQLIAQWKRLGRIAEGPSPEAQRRIDALTRPVPDRREVEIDLLQDRSLMLWDVRARIASMKQGLLALLEAADSRTARAGLLPSVQ